MDDARIVKSGGMDSAPLAGTPRARALADARRRNASVLPFERSALTGATVGFADELDAGAAAAETAIHGLVNKVTGRKPVGYSAKDAYSAVMRVNKEAQDANVRDHPFQTGATEFGGAVLTPGLRFAGGLIKGAATLGGAAARSAGVGAAYGAVAGAGNSDGGLIERSKGAGVGLIAGAALGGATPVAARAAVGLVRRGVSATSETASAVGRAVGRTPAVQALSAQAQQSAKDRALSYVATLTQRTGRSLEELDAHPAETMGKPITAAEAIGRPAMYQLQTLGKRSGTTADALEGKLEARRLDAPSRLTGDISSTLNVHPEAAKGSIDALVEQGQKAAQPLYDAALAHPGPISTPELNSLARRPVIQRALTRVAAELMNAGENPNAYGLEVTGMAENGLPETVTLKAPTAQTWDRVKKAVGGLVERNPITNKPLPNSVSSGNRDIAVASGDLTRALKEAIPGYGRALEVSGDYLSHQAAFDRVKGAVFKTQMTHADFSKMWKVFSPSQQEAARASIANDFHNLAQNNRLNPRLFNTPSVRGKLLTAFGPEKAEALIARVEQEALLAKGQRMTPGTNSTTGESAYAGDEHDAGLGLITAKTAGRLATGDVHGAVRGIGGAIVAGMMKPIHGASTPLAEAARNEVGRLLQLRPSELAAELRQFATRAPKAPMARGVRTAPVAAAGAGGYAANSP